MAVIEINDTRGGSFDGGNEAERTRLFIVQGVHPASLEPNTVASLYPPIPSLNSPYADGSRLILDRYDFALFTDGQSAAVRCLYTTSKIGRLPVPPSTSVFGYASWTWRWQEVNISIPYGRFDEFVDMANPSANFEAWTIHKQVVTEHRLIRTLRVGGTFDTMEDLVDGMNVCGDQANKIHVIGGQSVRYIAGSSQQIGNALEWEITHEWEYDKGTRTIENPAPTDPGKFFMPPTLTIPAGGFIRPPFYRLEAYNATNPKTTPPKYAYILPFTFDDDGYLGLPGVPGSL